MSNQSLLNRTPTNTSFLQPHKFTFEIPTLPFMRYFCQSVTFPGVSTTSPMVPSPFAPMYRHGDTLQFEQLIVQALIDEDLQVWQETFDWLVALTKPAEFEQYKRFYNPERKLYHDGVLTFNTNSNNPNVRAVFTYCHPVSISNIQMNTSHSADNVFTVDIQFMYDQYTLTRLT